MKMVNLKIDGVKVSVPENTTILQASIVAGIHIPTLCFLKDVNQIGACRICVVEVKGLKSLVASCVYPVSEGMEVYTNTQFIRDSRKITLELILSTHDKKCLSCIRNGNCELQKLCSDFGIDDENRFKGEKIRFIKDESAIHLVRDNNKCVLCRRCVAACKKQNVGVINVNERGFDTKVGCAFEKDLSDRSCVSCGQCIASCPTGALSEKDSCDEVMKAIYNENKYVIVNTAPSIRATLGECFGMPIGTNVKGKMVAALRRIGFDKVFDTDFGADLTIMEEAYEFLDRFQNNGKLPMITSCSPGWVKYCEYNYPDLIPNLSTCKSPQQMTGAIIKTWYAQKFNISVKDIVVVSVMPCTAKKFEITRENQAASGFPDTDISITTRELARLIKCANIDFELLQDEEFDSILGDSTGAGVIFGVTGGVMEAALRTLEEALEGKPIDRVDYTEVRGNKGVKEAVYNISGKNISVAVVNGLENVHEILDEIRSGESKYSFIEVMCCPGGCINGGGQPIHNSYTRQINDIIGKRMKAIYSEDKNLPLRKAHENQAIKMIYDEFLDNPGSEKAHEVLHTNYTKRNKF